MADYKESTVSGTAWQRARLVQINNERGTVPAITFVEERIVVLDDDRSLSNDVSQLVESYDAAKEFDLYDPVTLEPTGDKATHEQLYGLLFGLYMTLAQARDNPPVEVVPE